MSARWFPLSLVVMVGCGNVPSDPEADAGLPPPPGSTVYRGTLAMTSATPFGGTPFCNYTETLRQITMSIVVSANGAITDATAENLAVEATVPPCSFEAIPPQLHKYTFRSATPAGGVTMLALDPASANTPKASLAITVTPTAGAYTAVARWTRTDQSAPLAWSVTATLTLTLVP